MTAAEAKGATNSDAIAAFLAQITVYLSLIGFVIQVGLTSRIHRVLGIGFALLVLPVSLGTTAVIMLFNRALWAASPVQPNVHSPYASSIPSTALGTPTTTRGAVGAERTLATHYGDNPLSSQR